MDLHFEEHNNLSIRRFEKMLKTNAVYFFDSAEFERIIQYYIDSGKVNLAQKAIALGLQQHPDTIGLRLLKAELLILEDKLDTAHDILNEIEALEPSNEEVFIQKAALLSKKNQHTKAIELLKNALEVSEDTSLELLSMIGMEYLFLENFEKALLYFRNCIEIEPEDFTTLYNIVYCYDMLEKPIAAISFLEAHINNDPYSETAWHQLGRQYANTGNLSKAIKSFDFAIVIDEDFVGAYIEKAKVLEQQKHYQEAIDNYLITTELEDPTPFAYIRIASCFEKMNNPVKAHEFYLKAYNLDPSLDKTIIALADLSYRLKEYQNAIYYINKLINIDNKNPIYWKVYADSNLKMNFYEEASNAFQKCLSLNENSLEIFISLADTYYNMGDYQNAIKTLENAEVYYHKRASVYYRLSGLYLLTQSIPAGILNLKKGLESNPQKYRIFQNMFPILHNSLTVQKILRNYTATGL